ncbi:TPA: hypothetical protein VWN08_001507 [Streptococcus pneumoniae]|nr:hypothetical protein [Streptococcus pneumoniae]
MKRGVIYFFIGLSLLVWLVEMFTDWFDQALLRQFIHGALGFGFMIFVVFPMEMEWLKGESHDGG